MSGTAGSGGYYISMGARRVISQPSTITGSIGILFGKWNLSGLYEWLGMDVDRIKLSPNADMFSSFKSLTPEQRERIEGMMQETYDDFVAKAARARGMTYDELEPKAHGRIYTGKQALEQGLVDQLGGMTVAVSEMKKALNLADSDEIELRLYPKPKTFWESLASGDLLEMGQRTVDVRALTERLRLLETPKIWLLAPEIRIQ
jgi:protease-4